MNLFDLISEDIKKAMLAKNKVKLAALRGAKKEMLEAKTAAGANDELSDADALKIIQKLIKQRKDSAQIFTQQNRPDLAEPELEEIVFLQAYLPTQLTTDEVEKVIKNIISETGATSIKDMGKVMGLTNQKIGTQTEGKIISEIVKKLLS